MLKIDIHTHILPETLPKFADKFGYGDLIHLVARDDGTADMMKGDQFFRTIQPNCWDAELRIEEYARYNTKVQVVCTIPVMFSYWAKPIHCLELAQYLNDHIASLVEQYPSNYIGLGTVPMQDADLSIKELERLKRLGFAGIQIGSNINDQNLNEPHFFPIFEACQALDMCILVHPWNMMGMESMRKYWLPWLVGMPAETSRAICSMIFGGVHERLPNLRVCYAHAGGSFIGTIGRIEHGFNCRPDLVAIDNPVNPREYLGKFWVDCITHDERALHYIIEHVGSNRVCLGSDYPFPLGDLTIGKFIEDGNFDPETRQDIFYRSAIEWLGKSFAEKFNPDKT
ncbi:MAG: amidohydrolase family protein [Salibacteraceae bacterium]